MIHVSQYGQYLQFELLPKMIGARNKISIFLDEKPSWKKKTFESKSNQYKSE